MGAERDASSCAGIAAVAGVVELVQTVLTVRGSLGGYAYRRNEISYTPGFHESADIMSVGEMMMNNRGSGFIQDSFTVHSHFSERGYQGMLPVALIQRASTGLQFAAGVLPFPPLPPRLRSRLIAAPPSPAPTSFAGHRLFLLRRLRRGRSGPLFRKHRRSLHRWLS